MTAAKRTKAALYIAHYPAALLAAAVAARHHRTRYAFDAEDFHPGDWPNHVNAEERRLLRAIEERYLPGCAYMTAGSPGIAEAYANTYGIPRPTVVLNVFPRSQGPSGASPRGTVTPGPSLYWFSQTIGPNRGLECAVRAIARAESRPHLYLRGVPAVGFLDRLRALTAENGVSDRLHVLAPAPPLEMERLAAGYDIGLAGETNHTPNRKIALTNKLFSYVLAGIPVLMSDIPAHRAFASEAGISGRLYPVDDIGGLAKAIDSLLCDPEVLAAARAAAFYLGQTRFNWDYERTTLLVNASTVIAAGDTAPPTCTVPHDCQARGNPDNGHHQVEGRRSPHSIVPD